MEDSSKRSAALLSSYFPALDGVRAFSVFFVIFTHVPKHTVKWYFPGWLGVDIFFVLSGFLITYLLFREERKLGSIDMGAFYIRRAFRILPIYLFVLSLYVLLSAFGHHPEKWAEMKAGLPYFLTFMNDIPFTHANSPVGDMFGLSWTLGVEEKFYLVWPLFLFIMVKSFKARVEVQASFLAFTIAAAVFIADVLHIKFQLLGNLPRAYFGLLIGSALAVLLSSKFAHRYQQLVKRIPSSLVIVGMVLGFALVQRQVYFVYFFSCIVFLFISHLLLVQSRMSKCLALEPFVWVGKRSYCMYLIQGFGLNAAEFLIKPDGALQQLGIALLAFAFAIAGAALLHVLIEEPGRNLGKKILSNRSLRRERQILASSTVHLGSETTIKT